MKLFRIVGLTIVVGLTSACGSPGHLTGAEVATLLSQAGDASSQRNYPLCIDRYQKAVEARPDLVTAYVGVAKCRAAMMDYREAIANYGSAIHLSAKDPALYLDRAELEEKMGNFSTALDDCEFVATLSGASPEQLFKAATIMSDIGFILNGLDTADSGIKKFPTYWPLHLVRAQLERKLSNFPEALVEFNAAVALARSDRLLPVVERGIFYLERNMWKEARVDFTEAIRLAPERPELYDDRAKAEVGLGQLAPALLDFNTAADLLSGAGNARSASLAPVLVDRARLYLSEGSKARARDDLLRARSLAPPAADDLRQTIQDLLAAT